MYRVKKIYRPFLFLIDFFGYLLFFWTKLRKFRHPKKILCIRIENIGDVLLTTPCFRALKQRFPKAEVAVLVRSFSKEVLEGNRNIDKIICFDFPWLTTKGGKNSWTNTIRFIKKLRKEKYDLVFDFHADPRNVLLAFFAGKFRIGYGIRGFGFLLNRVVRFKRKLQHQIQYNLDLVRSVGADSSAEMDFFVPKDAENKAAKLIGPLAGRKLVGITPATGRKEKYWINRRWADVADALVEKYNAGIVLTGGKGDRGDVQEILARMERADRAVDLCGKTSLKELGAVIKKCNLFVCPDTGPAHIAKALDVPLLELFGPENPCRWGYIDEKSAYVWKQKMQDIKTPDVLSAVRKLGVLK